MTEILGEKRFKELVVIYYHLIKRREGVYINTLSKELGIDEDTLKLDIEYLNKKGYIEANVLYGYGGKITDLRILRLLPEGIDVVENLSNFDSINIIGVNTSAINVGGNLSIQESNVTQSNISNISATTIGEIEGQIRHMEKLLDNKEFKRTLEASKEELKQGKVANFKEKVKKAWKIGIETANEIEKFVALTMSILQLIQLIKVL